MAVTRRVLDVVRTHPAVVTVEEGTVMNGFGETNLIVIDPEGKVVINRRVVVQEPAGGYVTVYRGKNRVTMHCSPNCETPLVIGDEPAYFEAISKEIRTKQAIGQASAEGENQSE